MYHLLPPDAGLRRMVDSWARRYRPVAITRYAATGDGALRRAKGWAVFLGVVHLDQGLGKHPVPVAMGEAILRRISEGG